MTLSDRQKIFTRNIGLLIEHAFEMGFELTLGEVARTVEQQKIYFESGRSKTMDSRHIQRLAVDFNIFLNGTLLFLKTDQYKADLEAVRPLAEFWESLHPDNVWGGDWNRNNVFDETFRDPYHFEMKPN